MRDPERGPRLAARTPGAARNERKGGRITHRLKGKVNVELRPVQMVRCRALHVQELVDRCLSEPRELRKRDEQFLIVDQEPEPVSREEKEETEGRRTVGDIAEM